MSRNGPCALKPATVSALDSLDAMWSAFDAARELHSIGAVADRPPGGRTAKEYADHYGMPENTARDQLRKMEAAGTFRKVMVMIPDQRGHIVPTAVYVPCQR